MKLTMVRFTATLYMNNNGELTIANIYVDHNFQTWCGRAGLELTNNMYGSPLDLKSKHDQTSGRDMEALLI